MYVAGLTLAVQFIFSIGTISKVITDILGRNTLAIRTLYLVPPTLTYNILEVESHTS